MRWLGSFTKSMDMSLSKFQAIVKDREACMLQFMGLQRIGCGWATECFQHTFHRLVLFSLIPENSYFTYFVLPRVDKNRRASLVPAILPWVK